MAIRTGQTVLSAAPAGNPLPAVPSGNGFPYVVFDGGEYVVLYKPPFMHSASLRADETGTLQAWCGEHFPGFLSTRGKKAMERGLLHRLDYETQGLVFAALTQRVMDAMLRQQEEGLFIKEYEAVVRGCNGTLAGFPPYPNFDLFFPAENTPFNIESGFRFYGAGRKSVRPVAAGKLSHNGRVYQTQVTQISAINMREGDSWCIETRLTRGFRHQIRCHLAWLGFPILGDILYGGQTSPQPLSLRAVRLTFMDPLTNTPRHVTLGQR
jgi:23S rRNA pseudouridine1911/1915/1917 synthase